MPLEQFPDPRANALIRSFIKERRKLERFVTQSVLTRAEADYALNAPLDETEETTEEPGE